MVKAQYPALSPEVIRDSNGGHYFGNLATVRNVDAPILVVYQVQLSGPFAGLVAVSGFVRSKFGKSWSRTGQTYSIATWPEVLRTFAPTEQTRVIVTYTKEVR